MNRLTKKITQVSGFVGYIKSNNQSNQETLRKLGQLEDIEEELGVDLVTLFKALDECYIDGHKGTAIILNKEEIGIKIKLSDNAWTSKILKIKDYGKTWALTKEELSEK